MGAPRVMKGWGDSQEQLCPIGTGRSLVQLEPLNAHLALTNDTSYNWLIEL
jgi:hypothetical protein